MRVFSWIFWHSSPPVIFIKINDLLNSIVDLVDKFGIGGVDGRNLDIEKLAKININSFKLSIPMLIPIIDNFDFGISRFNNRLM